MKQVIAAGAVGLLCAGSALAQSSVTVYGVLDTCMAHTDADGKGSATSIDSGGYQASRIGFRGVEDPGGGLRASFQMESGFGSDTGVLHDSARLFNRQAWVGVGGGFGELRFGRQHSPEFLMIARLDPFGGATFASFLNNAAACTPRYDNVIGYISPTMGGFKLQAYYSRSERSETSRGLRVTMLAGEYEQGPLYLGIGSSRQNSANDSVAIQSSFAGGSYDHGQGRVCLGAYRGNNLGASPSTMSPGPTTVRFRWRRLAASTARPRSAPPMAGRTTAPVPAAMRTRSACSAATTCPGAPCSTPPMPACRTMPAPASP